MNELNLIQKLIIFAPALIFAITVHEAAHGWMAGKLGDNTARMMGRVTLNPIPHIDLVGTILVPMGMYALSIAMGGSGLLFGWAKPVPIDTRNLGNYRRDTALVAAAGPVSNLLMLLLWAVLMRLGVGLEGVSGWVAEPLIYMAFMGIFINALLMVLNLLPLLPLDGGRVMASLLLPRLAIPYSKLEPWGFMILIALIFSGLLWPILQPALGLMQSLGFSVAGIQ